MATEDSPDPWPFSLSPSELRELDARLTSYVRRRVPSPDSARDITQDVWLASVRYRGQSQLSTYLFAIARRRVADWYRKRGKVSLELPAGLPDPAAPDLDILEDHRRLHAAVALVPEPFLTALRLQLTGLDHLAIAKQLGCPPNTVRSRLSRGRRALRRLLGES